jgi:aryl-alcohol dehydrogenase-like predicted oxidoreductase
MVMDLVIPKRRLGQTDIEVSPIGLGVMQFSGSQGVWGFMFQDLPQEQMNAIVKAALDGGIIWFDTAEMYGRGRSERALARALKAAGKPDDEVVIGTKWLPLFRTAGNIPRSIEDRLRFLEGYSIGLYMVHQPWSFSPPEAEMEAMAGLVAAGKIRSIGVSNFNVEQMRRAHAALAKHNLPLAVNQVQYSLLHRDIETNGLLQAARDLGVTIVAWGPLGSGILTGKYHKDPDLLSHSPFGRRMALRRRIESSRPLVAALEEVAARYAVTPAQVALNWLINFNGESVVAIPGASRVQHAEQSARAMQFKLSSEDMQRLDQLSRDLVK